MGLLKKQLFQSLICFYQSKSYEKETEMFIALRNGKPQNFFKKMGTLIISCLYFVEKNIVTG